VRERERVRERGRERETKKCRIGKCVKQSDKEKMEERGKIK
jgi:hypothetical protein